MYISQHVFDSEKKMLKNHFSIVRWGEKKIRISKKFNLFLLDERERKNVERLKERDHLQPMVKIVRANSTTRLFEISRRGKKLVWLIVGNYFRLFSSSKSNNLWAHRERANGGVVLKCRFTVSDFFIEKKRKGDRKLKHHNHSQQLAPYTHNIFIYDAQLFDLPFTIELK